jgi:nucleoside-diphosphate-sugar epimerase
MNILLTGGAGDLGRVVTPLLEQQGHTVLRLDLRQPTDGHGTFIQGSILDFEALKAHMVGVDAVVHIAAWHGIHEFRKEKDVFDFWSLNVTGTFHVFEAAAQSGVRQMVYISSSSVEEKETVYGQTKILGEAIAQGYVDRHLLNVITLRPRAFIPYWNRVTYNNFVEWALWFWPGAVHINDVAQSVVRSLNVLAQGTLDQHLVLTVDGAYEYTDADLAAWDADGAGSTFRKYYAPYESLAVQHGLNPALRPEKRDISATRQWLGYAPQYSLLNLLQDLQQYGLEGPPPPV